MDDNSNQRLKWFEVVILWEVRILIKHCWASRSYINIKQGLFANTFKFRLLKNIALLSVSQLLLDLRIRKICWFSGNSRMGHWDWFTASLPRRWIELACLHWQKHCSYPGLWWGVTPGSSCHFLCWRFFFFQSFYGCWENSVRLGVFFSNFTKHHVLDDIRLYSVILAWPFYFHPCVTLS